MSTVHIEKIRNDNIKHAVSLSLSRLIDETITANDTVLLKPNFLNDKPAETGVTTDLRIIRAVGELLQEKGIKKIYLGEASFSDTEKNFQTLKVYELEKYGIKVINLEKEERITADFPQGYVLKKMILPAIVYNADVIIDIPKLKTHCQTYVTLSLKNLFGFLYTAQRKLAHREDVDAAIIDIYTYLVTVLRKKFISIVDALICLDGRLGPNIGTPVKKDLLISGIDLLSVDAACVRIMGRNPRKIPHLLLCEKKGLGEMDPETTGEPIEKVAQKFTIPGISVYLLPQLTRLKERLVKTIPVIKYPDRCTQCGYCVSACPQNCIRLTPEGPRIDYKICINCLCCYEGCPAKVYIPAKRMFRNP